MFDRFLNPLVLVGLIVTTAHAAQTESAPGPVDGCVGPLSTLRAELLAAGVDQADASATFASIRPAGLSQLIAYTMVQQFIDDRAGDLRGYFIHGESKVGKSKLAVAFAHEIASQRGLPLLYVTHGNVERIWSAGAPESLAKYGVIVFDGLLDRPKSDPKSSRLLELFERAVEMVHRTAGKKILATSRLSLEDVAKTMYPVRDERRAFEERAFSIFQAAKLRAN